MDLQLISAIIFSVCLAFFLVWKRKNLAVQKIFFPVLYFVMYRTKIGLKLMDTISKKYGKLLKYLGYIGIFIGFCGMVFLCFTLSKNLVILLTKPEAASAVGLVLPFKVKGAFFVPFFYWIISIFVLAVVHEFSHGVVARYYGLKIKSSGLAFLCLVLPVIPAAFVEPDEKKMAKLSTKKQLSIFAAGPFSNIILAFIVLLLFNFTLAPFLQSMMYEDGIKITGYIEDKTYPAQEAGIEIGEVIKEINGAEFKTLDDFSALIQNEKPGDQIQLTTNIKTYDITLTENPEDEKKAYLGVYLIQNYEKKDWARKGIAFYISVLTTWLGGLFYWLFVLNLGIGLFNLIPIGPIDGGRMLHAVLLKYFSKDRAQKIWKYTGTFFFLLVLTNVMFGFIR
ncbi:MAG: site-2 protease family protein [Nanoarchaeota archaeon]